MSPDTKRALDYVSIELEEAKKKVADLERRVRKLEAALKDPARGKM